MGSGEWDQYGATWVFFMAHGERRPEERLPCGDRERGRTTNDRTTYRRSAATSFRNSFASSSMAHPTLSTWSSPSTSSLRSPEVPTRPDPETV